MKNRFVFMSLLLSGCCIAASAQEKKHYYSERFQDNLFISVGVGGQACLNPDNKDYGFGHAITPQISLSLGKWINPVWGVRLQGAGVWSKLNQKWVVSDAGKTSENYYSLKNKFVQGRIDGMFNFSNAIWGYNPNRLFNASIFVGPGLTFAKTYKVEAPAGYASANGLVAKNAEAKSDIKALITGSVGLIGQFNVSKHWDINIEVRGDVSPSIYGEKGANTDGAIAALVGASYTFGKGKHFVASNIQDIKGLNDEINRYRQELANRETELNNLRNNPPQVVEKEVVKEVTVAGTNAFFFNIGKADISDRDKVNIKYLADIMKANPDKKYKVAGYADKATGSAKFNQRLSEKRAKAIADALIAEGVNKDQIETIGCGGTPNMFGKNRLNRVVILEAVK